MVFMVNTIYFMIKHMPLFFLKNPEVNKENYLKISKIYVLMEHFKKFEISKTLHDLSNGILVSLTDILCEFLLLEDTSGYQPIRNLDRTLISKDYQTFSLSEFYRWDYILLRDMKTFGRSVLDVVKYGKFSG